MIQTVRVQKLLDNGSAQVVHIRQSACSGDCHKCSGCGAVQETMALVAANPIGAQPGDLVVIESKTGPVLAAAAILYVVPLVLFFLGYLIGFLLWNKGPLCACVGFLLGIVVSVLYDRHTAKKKQIAYTITGYAQTELHGF